MLATVSWRLGASPRRRRVRVAVRRTGDHGFAAELHLVAQSGIAGDVSPQRPTAHAAAKLADPDPGFRRTFLIGGRPDNDFDVARRRGSSIGDVSNRKLPGVHQSQQGGSDEIWDWPDLIVQ
jgi:hypothetical protein